MEWTTIEENNKHAHQTGLTNIKGEKHGSAKISEEQAKLIIQLLDEGLNNSEILKLIPNATNNIINKIKYNQRWKHLMHS